MTIRFTLGIVHKLECRSFYMTGSFHTLGRRQLMGKWLQMHDTIDPLLDKHAI